MKFNVGAIDRAVRIILGILFLLLVAYAGGLPTWGALALYAAGAMALISGAVGFCPLYPLFGISTCGNPMKQKLSHGSKG